MAMVTRDLEKLSTNFKPLAIEILELIAAHNLPFKVFETLRTKERQEELFKKGTTKTMNSKHLEGNAIDFVVFIDGKWSWENKHRFYYDFLGALVNSRLSGKVRWGGNFKSFYDGPHFELIG